MRRPALSNQSQMLLTGVLIVCVVVSLVVESYLPGLIAVALAVLLLVVRTTPSDGADDRSPRGRR